MDAASSRPIPRTYIAHLERGPQHGTETCILGLDSGDPPDLLLTPGRRDGVYVLAGGARMDGSLPYLWMSRERVTALRSIDARRAAKRAMRA